MDLEHRARQAGKTVAVAERVSKRSGLSAVTCGELLRAGWTYSERLNEPSRWESQLASALIHDAQKDDDLDA